MHIVIPLLFLPAVVLWLVASLSYVRAMQNVSYDQGFITRLNPVIWLSSWNATRTFDENGQRLLARAIKARRWFLRYCVVLLILLIGVGVFSS